MISAVLVLGTSSQSELLELLRKQLPVKKPKLMLISLKWFFEGIDVKVSHKFGENSC